MHDLIARFFEPDNEADERMLLRLKQELTQWQSLCDQAGLSEPLPLTVVREHWLSALESAGLQQRFFGGGVQFSTLMPMRAIPFKGLCLLGMNDGAYPRQSTPRDFDLMTDHWRAGDRSRREDDRYLFLEAFLSAREKLYISWQGRRSTDNQLMPPSVLVSQLRDALKARFTPETPANLQPLQAFSVQYFQPNAKFFTYADDWEKAQATRSALIAAGHPPLQKEVLIQSEDDLPVITEWPLSECMRLLKQPVEVYWRSRLGVQLKGPEEALQDDENFALSGLDRYLVGRSLLEADDIAQQLEAETLMGLLPMGAAGQGVLKQQYEAALRVIDRAAPYAENYPTELATQSIVQVLSMPWGDVRISAEVSNLRQGDLGYLQITSRPGAVATGQKDQQTARADVLINLWPSHVLMCAAGYKLRSVAVGLDGVAVLPSLDAESAKQLLSQWLTVYRQAWAQPLPVTFKAGLAFVAEQAKQAQSNKEANADLHDEKVVAQSLEKSLDKASKAFADNFSEDTDLARSLYVQRSFDHFDLLRHALPQWAPLLYEDLIRVACMEGEAP
jgi:exodeoxyribonuclease V gamma subunit